MLYVFLVDSGTMFTFEVELAMESVETLMQAIQQEALIPVDKQVLLVTGGKALLPGRRVCNYTSAGTEDNPIFMFSKSSIEAAVPPSPSFIMGSESSLEEQVQMSLRLPSTYETLVSRAKLASEFQRLALELSQSCECLVHDQILQQQGWIAVVANMETITRDFSVHARAFETIYSNFLSKKQQFVDILANFGDVLDLLSQIPILPSLLSSEDVKKLPPGDSHSLLAWINAQDEKSSLEAMAEQSKQVLSQFETNVLSSLLSEVQAVLDASNNTSMKEIRGLDERQAGLQQLLLNVHHLTQEQADLAKGFQQNQSRALNVGDPSILPDLCAGHQKQLLQLLKKHSQLRDLRKRCAKAKDELSTNLHARLRWVMFTERKICDCDSNLILHHEHLKRLKCRLDILDQVHNTPKLYITTLAEIIRRKNFSQHFLKWASDVRQSADQVHDEELSRRQQFASFFDHHFLSNLFKGLDDKPERLFSQSMSVFDSCLPDVSEQDLTALEQIVPQLSTLVRESLQESMERSSEEPAKLEYSGHELGMLKIPVSTRLSKSDEGVYKQLNSEAQKNMSKEVTDDLNKGLVGSMEASAEGERGEKAAEEVDGRTLHDLQEGGVAEVVHDGSDADISTDEENVERTKVKHKTKKARQSILRQVLVRHGELEDSNGSEFLSASEKLTDEDDSDSDAIRNEGYRASEPLRREENEGDTHPSVCVHSTTQTDDHTSVGAKSPQVDKETQQDWATELQEGSDHLQVKADTRQLEAEGITEPEAGTSGEGMHDAVENGASQQAEVDLSHLKTIPCLDEETKDHLNQYKSELDELYKTKELLEEKILDQKHSLSSLNEQLCTIEQSSQDTQRQNESLRENCKEMQTVLREEFLTLRQKLKDSRNGIECMRNEMQTNSLEMLSRLSHKIKTDRTLSVENKVTETKLQYDRELKSMRDKYVEENQVLLTAKKELQTNCERLRGELEHMRKEKDCLEDNLKKCKEENRTVVSEYDDKISSLKRTISEMYEARVQFVAEQQVSFNNAVSKVVKEKEQLCMEMQEKIESLVSQNDLSIEKISSLQQKCEELQNQREQDISTFASKENDLAAKLKEAEEQVAKLENLIKEKENFFKEEMEKERRSQLLLMEIEKQSWEEEKQNLQSAHQSSLSSEEPAATSKAQTQIQQLQEKVQTLEEEKKTWMEQSMVSLTTSVAPDTSVQELSEALKAREEQCNLLKSQLVQEKSDKKPSISLQDFRIGDVALFVFDEARENYLIFTLSPMLYFLHANSVDALGLNSAQGKRRSFFVGRIVDKEFVEAKKPNNRFKVPVGTRFYRVQAQFL